MSSGIFYKIINSVSSGVSWASSHNQMPSDGHYKDLELRHLDTGLTFQTWRYVCFLYTDHSWNKCLKQIGSFKGKKPVCVSEETQLYQTKQIYSRF